MKLEEFFNKTKIISNAINEICEHSRKYYIHIDIDATKIGRNYTTESRKFIGGNCISFSEVIEIITNSDADQELKEAIIHTINTCDFIFKEETYDDSKDIEGRLNKEDYDNDIFIKIIVSYILAEVNYD